jgi:hypothetical protein
MATDDEKPHCAYQRIRCSKHLEEIQLGHTVILGRPYSKYSSFPQLETGGMAERVCFRV